MKTNPILLVEDDPNDARLTRRAFSKSNLVNELIVVTDGAAAVEHLQAAAQTQTLPALVLLDLNLPKIDGLGVLRHIRANEQTRRLPVIILTSSKEQQDLINSYDLGANSYVRKPVDFDQFVEAIQQLGLYWLVLNEYPQNT